MQHNSYDPATINAALLDQVDTLIPSLYPGHPVKFTIREARVGRRGSLAIDRRKGVFYDNEAGTGGDIIALVQHALGYNFKTALEWAGDFVGAGYIPPERRPARALNIKEYERVRRRVENARRIWRESVTINGTLAAGYLREHRGIAIALPPSLRFHSCLPYARDPHLQFPAMVAAVQNINREIIGVQATYLDPDTGKKIALDNLPARLSLGAVKGGAVRLSPARKTQVLCEGVEDSLSIMQTCPGSSAWACLGTSGLRGVELPEAVKEAIIAGDADAPGKEAAETLKHRLQAEGRKVAVVFPEAPHKDFNSMMMWDEA